MQRVRDLSPAGFRNELRREGLRLRVGPYIYSIQSPLPVVAQGIETLYGDFQLAEQVGFADFHVSIRPPSALQRMRGRVDFYVDDKRPFNRILLPQAWAFLEWGMNWCVSVRSNEYLKLHAGVVAKNGVAIVMPGLPGAGKSTLCAALATQGWRVLSDEHALIPLGSANVVPLPRPVSLKNESIELLQDFSPNVRIGPISTETHKGRVAHMKSDLTEDSHAADPIAVGLMLFPNYSPGASYGIRERSSAESFMFAAHHAFNYSLLGAAGFDAMADFIDGVHCFDVSYSNLDDAIRGIEDLHSQL